MDIRHIIIGVYLINDMCNTFYRSKNGRTKVRGTSINDIINVMDPNRYQEIINNEKLNPTFGQTKEYSNVYYPEILRLEKNQEVDGIQGNTYDADEQNSIITQNEEKMASQIKIKDNYIYAGMKSTDFINDIYFELFINNGTANYDIYWLASRYRSIMENQQFWGLGLVYRGNIGAATMYSIDGTNTSKEYRLRPIVILGSDVEIVESDLENHNTIENAWEIKE